ncbi:MAG: response regulator [Brevinematales bacterium]|nr:response regulator [Brevinematales bacterium]
MKKIVIIDDQRDVLHLLEKTLRAANYDVLCLQFIPKIEDIMQENPDLVIIDLLMPGIAGYTLGHEIITRRTKDKPRVILISGRNEDILKQKTHDIGADGWLSKPFRAEDVLVLVQRLIG